MKDLLKRDPQTVAEIAKWLEIHADKPRDRSRKVSSRRMMARLIAARQLLKAAEGDTQTSESVMNRTEGKVADIQVRVDGNEFIAQLEAARQRVLNREPQQLVGASVEGEIVTDSTALTVLESKTSK